MMERTITRRYSFSDREIREALIATLKAKDRPAPIYVGNTPDCTWTQEVAGLTVEWTEKEELDI